MRRYFADFAQTAADSWDDVIKAVSEPCPGTRGVIWLRRKLGGHEATGPQKRSTSSPSGTL